MFAYMELRLPKLMKMVEGGMEKYEINSMGKHRGQGERRYPAEKRREC